MRGGEMMPSILFIGKKNDACCERAVEFVRAHFEDRQFILGSRGDPFPEGYGWQNYDYIISYLSPWIIPDWLLQRATKAALNFHPGPPDYPGIGCTNFAIYDEALSFGVTCHHMAAAVDTGNIVDVRRFPIYETDTVYSLTQRSYGHMLSMFYAVMGRILCGLILPESVYQWTCKPYTRAELDELCRIEPGMPEDEIKRRIQATTFPGMPGAYVVVGGERFEYKEGE